MSIFPWHKQEPENTMLVHVSKTAEQKNKPYIVFLHI